MVSAVSTGRAIHSLRAPLTTQLLSNPSLVCTRWPTSLFWGSLSFSVLLLASCSAFGSTPVARRWESSLYRSQAGKYLGQFITESILIAIPAFVCLLFSQHTARAIGNTVLANVTSGVAKPVSMCSSL